MEIVLGPDEIRERQLMYLMDRYEKDLLRMCCVYLRDIALAEDAVQETFLKAYRALNDFRGESSEKTWLMRIAVNTCKDMRRSGWFRHVDRRITPDQLPQAASPAREGERQLTVEIMKLPVKYREQVLLAYYHELTGREAAEAMGITDSAFRSRLMRARDMLRMTLGEEAEL